VKSFSIVRIVAAFVAGVVVALGSALIYVRVTDTGHIPPPSQTSVVVPSVPADLPVTAFETKSEPEVVPEGPKVPARRKPAVERHRTFVTATFPKVAPKPVQIAKNDARPVLHMPPAAPAAEPVPAQTVPAPAQQDAVDQPPANIPPVAEPPAATPPAPQPHVVTLAPGTVLTVRLGESVSTEHNYTGDTFRATLTAPIIQDGFIIADKGSKVLGHVANAQSAGHMANAAALSLVLTEINTTDGQRVPVETNIYDRRGSSNAGQDVAKIAGGAALGAMIGGLAGGGKGAAIGAGAGGAAGTGAVLLTHGRGAVVENETQLTFRLASPVTITEKLN
jgi:hypothetical protein